MCKSADRDFTDVPLVSEDTNWKLYLCDSGDSVSEDNVDNDDLDDDNDNDNNDD